MAADPVVLRVVRPYESSEEYLAAEAWSFDARSMLLIGEAPLPPDTPVVFEVTLKDGSRPIKAEARVSGAVEAKDGRPAGLRVRFRRYGASTKAFIERATAFAAGGSLDAVVAPAGSAAEPSGPGASSPEASAPIHVAPEAPSPARVAPEPPAPLSAAVAERARPASLRPDVPGALAALRARGDRAFETPANREYLLEKLRQRNAPEDVTVRFQRD